MAVRGQAASRAGEEEPAAQLAVVGFIWLLYALSHPDQPFLAAIGLVTPVLLFVFFVRTLAAENARLHREADDARGRAIEAMDAGRRSIERDLHDGAQQRLVNLSMSLSLARTRFAGAPEASAALDRAMTELDAALEELRELAHGIYPAVLATAGLGPALRSLTERSALPVALTGLPVRRLPPRVEETVYFVVSEAIANACKHARASEAAVVLDDTGAALRLTVSDDGVGGADLSGHGLRGLADRVTVLGGRFVVESPPGQGTRMAVCLPVAGHGRSRCDSEPFTGHDRFISDTAMVRLDGRVVRARRSRPACRPGNGPDQEAGDTRPG